jgi:uncharacterized membrane protein SirB2
LVELHAAVRHVHVAAVVASGGLFLVRGLARGTGAGWVMAAPLRYLSYGVDTVLLIAALTLAAIVRQYPFVHGWLTVKVVLLIVYIVLGSLALKRGKTWAVRTGCFVAALLVYGFIVGVARARHTLGFLAGVAG